MKREKDEERGKEILRYFATHSQMTPTPSPNDHNPDLKRHKPHHHK
jgi:hypothetical protein